MAYRHRAFDPAGQKYVYWVSINEFDASGQDYVGPPAFETLQGVVSLGPTFTINQDIVHRAWYPTNSDYEYWTHTAFDPTKAAYAGPANPVDLEGVAKLVVAPSNSDVALLSWTNVHAYGPVDVSKEVLLGAYGNISVYGPVYAGPEQTLSLTAFGNISLYGPVSIAQDLPAALTPYTNTQDFGEYIATVAYGNTGITGFPALRQVNLLTGRVLWEYTVPTTEYGVQRAQIDRNGRTLMSEHSPGTLLRVIDKNGNFEWSSAGGTGSTGKCIEACADDDGNVFATFYGVFSTANHGSLVKYNAAGVEQWTVFPFSAESQPNGYNLALYCVTDSNGDVYVCNVHKIRKYTAAGDFVWEATVGGVQIGHNILNLFADRNGSIYASLDDYTAGGGGPGEVWKGNQSNGNQVWRQPMPNGLRGVAVCANRSGSRVVVASSTSAGGSDPVEIYAYDSAGNLDWTYEGEPWLGLAVKINEAGVIAVSWATGSGPDWHLLQDNGASVSVINNNIHLSDLNATGMGWAYAGRNVVITTEPPIAVELTAYTNAHVYGAVAVAKELTSTAYTNTHTYGPVLAEVIDAPQVRSTSVGADNTGTTRTINLPATIEAGDLILIFWAIDEADGTPGPVAAPSGFSQISGLTPSNIMRTYIWVKKAVGTEGGTSVSVTDGTPGGNDSSYVCYAISNWSGGLQNITVRDESKLLADYNPAGMTSLWPDGETYLCLAGAMSRNWGASMTVTPPAGYSTPLLGGTYTITGGCYVAVSHKECSTAFEDPGLFDVVNSTNGGTIANHVFQVAVPGPVGARPSEFVALWDAVDNVDGYADTNAVGTWTDSVASIALTTFGSSTAPQYLVAAGASPEGESPAIEFDGVLDALRHATLPSQSQPYTLWYVVDMISNSATDYISDGFAAANDADLSYNGTTFTFSAGTPVSFTRNHLGKVVIEIVVNGASSSAYQTGEGSYVKEIEFTGSDVGSENMLGLCLGALASGAQAANMWLNAVGVCSGALSAATRDTIRSYLVRKHNVSALSPEELSVG